MDAALIQRVGLRFVGKESDDPVAVLCAALPRPGDHIRYQQILYTVEALPNTEYGVARVVNAREVEELWLVPIVLLKQT